MLNLSQNPHRIATYNHGFRQAEQVPLPDVTAEIPRSRLFVAARNDSYDYFHHADVTAGPNATTALAPDYTLSETELRRGNTLPEQVSPRFSRLARLGAVTTVAAAVAGGFMAGNQLFGSDAAHADFYPDAQLLVTDIAQPPATQQKQDTHEPGNRATDDHAHQGDEKWIQDMARLKEHDPDLHRQIIQAAIRRAAWARQQHSTALAKSYEDGLRKVVLTL